MKIRTWMAVLVLTAFSGISSAGDCSEAGGMDQFRADAMAGIHAENRAALQKQLHDTRNAMRDQARESFLAQQPAPSTGRPTAKSAP
ncbi:MAG: hypothetical protein ACT4QA_00295 [Panacagrimonas sp.]